MSKWIKQLVAMLLILISVLLVSCGSNKLEKYFDISLSDETGFSDLADMFGIKRDAIFYGILIKPKNNMDLKVQGKVIFKKFKMYYYESGMQNFISNKNEFEINLNEKGYSLNNYGILTAMDSLKDKNGEWVFPNDLLFNLEKKGTIFHISDYDAYFEGTVEENR